MALSWNLKFLENATAPFGRFSSGVRPYPSAADAYVSDVQL
jgi:hypothetical protein